MCRLEKFHLPLRPNLKDWNMMTLNKKWMRLMVLVGCAALTASCKQAPVAQMEAGSAVLILLNLDTKSFMTALFWGMK